MYQKEILYYSFIVIFIATSIVTLVGVMGYVIIDKTHLNMLLTAFLLGIAGAIVALFKKTNFFSTSSGILTESLGSAVSTFDQISDEIKAAIEDKPVDHTHAHGFLILRRGDSVVAYRKMKVITAEELENLPADQKHLIRQYEKSMNSLLKEWKKIKGGGIEQLDSDTRKRALDLLRAMKDDLVGVLNFLERQGVYLDDHYAVIRSLVSEL